MVMTSSARPLEVDCYRAPIRRCDEAAVGEADRAVTGADFLQRPAARRAVASRLCIAGDVLHQLVTGLHA